MRLLLGVRAERQFWSESWLGADTLLSKIAERLNLSQGFRAVEVDDGWHPDRDIRAGVPGVGALDLRVLVEEHSRGRCLARVSVRLRLAAVTGLAPFGAAALAGLAVPLVHLPGSIEWTLAGVAPAVVGLIAWKVSRTVGVLRSVVEEVTRDLGLYPIGAGRIPTTASGGEPGQAGEAAHQPSPSASSAFPLASHERQI